ncbi:MAG: hypothetical protein HMLIMOIP_000082 [Candidatus Nitrosomirales archaeon]|jgi:hypothetical protein
MQVLKHMLLAGFIIIVLTLSLSINKFQVVNAQQAYMSVSALDTGGKFFGPQIIQIIIDGSGIGEPNTSAGALIVNGVNVPLVHLSDSRWYAYVADQDTFTTLADAADFPRGQVSALGGSFWSLGPTGKPLLFPSLPGAFRNDPATNSLNPNLDLNGDCAATISDQDVCVEWPYIRLFSFNENDQVSFRYSSQSVTLDYIEPSLDDVSISLDRDSYPIGAEIIVNLRDYMWNINPVEEDMVHFAFTNGEPEVFYQATSALTPASLTGILNSLGFDSKQVLDAEGVDGIKFTNAISGNPETVLVERFPNSGVFENFDRNTDRADMFANKRDAQIRFDYFDKSTASGMSTHDASVSVGKEEVKEGTPAPEVEEPQMAVQQAPYSISEPIMVDVSGSSIDSVVTGEPILVETKVTNNIDEEQAFMYILQVKDSNDYTVMLTWIKGAMNALASMDAGISWTPEEDGNYTVEIFVWKSLEDPGLPLTKNMTVTVE